jgi:hypothetical protein
MAGAPYVSPPAGGDSGCNSATLVCLLRNHAFLGATEVQHEVQQGATSCVLRDGESKRKRQRKRQIREGGE